MSTTPVPTPPAASPETPPRMDFVRRVQMVFATGFGSGLSPKAPGTCGTFAAIFVYLPFAPLNAAHPALYAVWLVGFLFFAVWAADGAEKHYRRHDVGNIVIDEFHGFFTTMFLVPANARTLLAAFVIFRVLDILKPPPAKQIDRGWLPGGWGVVLDDTVSGVYACLILHGLIALRPHVFGL